MKTDKNGYIMLLAKGHPRAERNGHVPEHLLIAEKAIGRYLSGRNVIHHVDGNPGNNARTNLVVCQNQGYHMLLHQRQRALDACGNASARKCNICGSYENQGDMVICKRNGRKSTDSFHRECRRQYMQRYYRSTHPLVDFGTEVL